MNLGDWGSFLGGCAGVAALALSLWNRRKAGEAALRALNAEERAEEALQIAKKLVVIEEDRHQRETSFREGEELALRWVQQIQKRQKPGFRVADGQFSIAFPVNTAAEFEALKILKRKQRELSVSTVTYHEDRREVVVSGVTYPSPER